MNIPPDVIETMAAGIGQTYADHSENAAHEAARAALSVLADNGWVVVPKEPTEAMLKAAAHELGWVVEPYKAPRESGVAVDGDMSQEDADRINKDFMETLRGQYQVMLAAALPTKDTSHG